MCVPFRTCVKEIWNTKQMYMMVWFVIQVAIRVKTCFHLLLNTFCLTVTSFVGICIKLVCIAFILKTMCNKYVVTSFAWSEKVVNFSNIYK